jgi:6-phosphogluconolactonase
MYRVTMTAPLINRSHHILFLVTGENKADVLKKVISGPPQSDLYPAQLINPLDGELRWFVDEAAASLLNPEPNR